MSGRGVAGAGGIGLADFLKVFELGARSGVLQLLQGEAFGIIYIAAGCIVDATLAFGPERIVVATREQAILQMLGWGEATLRFHHDPSVASRVVRVERDLDALFADYARDLHHTARADALDAGEALQLVRARGDRGVMLSALQWRLVRLLAAGASIASMAEHLDLDQATVRRALVALLENDLVEPTSPPPDRWISQPPSVRLGLPVDATPRPLLTGSERLSLTAPIREQMPRPGPAGAGTGPSSFPEGAAPAFAGSAPVQPPSRPSVEQATLPLPLASAPASTGPSGPARSTPPAVERGMLRSIMRRIRSL